MATLKNTTINDTGYLQIASGTQTQRPASPALGMVRYNQDTGNVEGYASTGWHILSPFNLKVTGVTITSGFIDALSSTKQINPAVSAVFVIKGFNFTAGSTVKLDTTQISSGVVITNPETITVTTGTSFNVSAGSYSNIVVTDVHGKTSTFAYPITVVGGPVFSTASSLGTFTEGSISTSVAATSPSLTVTYSANSTPGNGGSGYGLPAGLTLNSSTGAITGSLTVTGSQAVTYNITIKATDNFSTPRTASKDFTLIVTNATSPTITATTTGQTSGSLGTLYYRPVADGSGVTAAPVIGITTFNASNPSSGTLYYNVTSGSLPPGIYLNSLSGALAGTLQVGTKQPASQTFNFGVTVTDSLNNSSSEVQFSLNVSTPYYYRQILTTGYSLAGYKSSTPWKNVNRLVMNTEITISLGDQLTYAVNYHGGTCGADKAYIMGCNSSGGMQATGSITQVYNMRTEVGTTGYTSSYTRGAAAVWAGNDGYQLAAYTSGGFQGTGANVIEKMPFSTETATTISATLPSTNNFWNAITGSTETFAGIIGANSSAFDGSSVSGSSFFTYSTDTISSASVNISNGAQEKVLSSKLNRVYGGTSGGTSGSASFTKTVWSDLTQSTITNNYGGSSEQNYIMGQDRGWCIGLYTGSSGSPANVQSNDSFRMIYATDTSSAANIGTSRKGVSGSSSGNYGYRD
jgi:hypothetical protein